MNPINSIHESLAGFITECRSREINSILVLGCGHGLEIKHLAENGFEVTGVDSSPADAALVEDLLQASNLVGKVFVDNLFDKVSSFAAEDFPAVVAISSLQFTDLNTFVSVTEDIARILAPKGLLLLVVDSKESAVDPQREQLVFAEDELTKELCKRFSVLDFYKDNEKNLVALLEKISH